MINLEGFCQKQTTHIQQVWMGYINHARFSDKWGTWAEGQVRTKEDFFQNLSQLLFRVGLSYYASERVKLTAGYAFFNFYPADNHPGVSQPEHRPWQQVLWNTNYPRLRFVQYFRLEERFRRKIKSPDELGEGYNFNWRTRYNVSMMLPLARQAFAKNTFSFVLNDEVMINLGKEIVYNYFDQNRFFAGFAYHVTATDNLQFGYLNLFQQLAAGNRYRMIHVPRVMYYHNLDLRKKSKTEQ
jgi:hypothetical protein